MTGVRLMSDFASVSSPEHSAPESGQPDSQSSHAEVSPGTMLRQAREAAGLHVAALAVALKVPVKKLEALEADRFELLPDAVFVRALAASICRTLKIDPAPVLQRLPRNSNPQPAYQRVGINAPFRAPGDGPGPSVWTHISRPAALAGLLLLMGALVLIFLPAVKIGIQNVAAGFPVSAATAESATTPVVGVSEPVNDVAVKLPSSGMDGAAFPSASTASAGLPSDVSPVAVASVLTATQVVAMLPPAVSGSASSAPVLTSPAAAASSALPMPSTGIVVFTAKGDSWVEVTDAKGVVVLRRTLVPGEVAGASGVLPLAAVVGRADATEVKVRGKVFELATFAKDNVARFEVK